MLIIRKEQMKAFENAALRNFENEMVEHIQQYAPQQSEIIGEPGVRKVVKLGIERAGNHYFTNQGPVRFYLELMCMFGSDFDTDPQYPWVAEILNDHDRQGTAFQMERADRLYNEVTKYIGKVFGPKDSYEKEVLTSISHKRFKDFPTSEENFSTDVIRYLNEISPYKCANIEEKAIYALIQTADEQAKTNRIESLSLVALFVLMMFKFGHGCYTDPQYPWIAETLSDSTVKDPDLRVEKLHSKMKSYCDNALALMTKKR